MTKHIFIIGSKGIPANYGGFETFVDKLAENRIDTRIQYHVACMGKENKEFTYKDANCFMIKVPDIGPARAVYYDIQAIKASMCYVREHHLENVCIYVLACRIGPFIGYYKHKMKALGITLYVNPDGHEWLRGKWSTAIKKYWKLSERFMVKHADLIICDSRNIENYIQKEYVGYTPKTTFIAYGADIGAMESPDSESNNQKLPDSKKTGSKATKWYQSHHIIPNEYYLVVGRFVPENNYETMIKEFMRSTTSKDLVIITNVEHNKFYETLVEKTGFVKDSRIKFVGTVYDSTLLIQIRKDAFAYLHGHEVGGTNPSLLEALSITNLNLLLDVGFNREVGEDGAMYFRKEQGSLSSLIEQAEHLKTTEILELGQKAKQRIREQYSWTKIVMMYETLFMTEGK